VYVAEEQNRRRDSRRRRPYRLVLWFGAAVLGLALLVLAAAAGVVFLKPDLLEPIMVRAASAAGYRAEYRALTVSVDPPALTVEGLELVSRALPAQPEPAAGASGLRAEIPAATLVLDLSRGWKSGVWIDTLEIESPDVEVYAPGGEPGAGDGNPLRALALFREMVLTNGELTMRTPGRAIRVRELWAGVGEGEAELERTFRISAQAAYENANAAKPEARLVEFEIHVQGGISPDGGITADARVEKGEAAGAYAAKFAGRAELEARGETLALRSAFWRLRDIEAEAPGLRRLAADRADLRFSGSLDGSGGFALDAANATITKPRAVLEQGGVIEFEELSLKVASAGVDLRERALADSSFTLAAPGLFRAGVNMAVGPEMLDVRAEGEILSLGGALQKASAFLPPESGGYEIRGALPFRASISGSPDSPEITASTGPESIRVVRGDLLDARVSGEVDVSGSPGGSFALSGDIRARGRFESGAMLVRKAAVRAGLGGSLAAPVLSGVSLKLPAGGLVLDGEPSPPGALEVTAERAELKACCLLISGLAADTERLGEFSGEMALDLDEPSRSTANLSAASLDAASLYAFLVEAGLMDVELSDISGTVDLELGLAPVGGELGASVSADFSGLGLGAARGEVLISGLSGGFSAGAGSAVPRRVEVRLAVESGEALFGTYYLDFGGYPSELEADFTMAGPRDFFGADARIVMRNMGEAELVGGRYAETRRGALYAGRLEVCDPNLPNILEVFVKEPLSFARPDLAELSVNGTAGFSCDFEGRDEVVDVTGLIEMEDLVVDYPAAGVAAGNLDLRLPFDYRLGEAVAGPERSLIEDWGVMAWKSMTLPTGRMRAGAVTLALAENVLYTRGKQRIPLPGGAVVIGPVRLDEPLSSGNMRLRTSASLEKLDLSELPTDPIRLQGELSGELSSITADSERLDAEGEVRGAFFGGELDARGFMALRPFSEGRVLGVNEVTVTGIELTPLSKALEIGLITGRLDVGLKDYRQAYGQPVHFELSAETREVEDVPRKVSLKAVNSISVMGTGSGLGDVGVGMFASFFETFSYEAMGVYCSLENDVFRVRGLIQEGGVEYLIKKPLFFGINVVNRNPNNSILFSDMVERVQRVVGDEKEKQGKTSSKEES
jgi:hypothetical protein